MKNQRAERLHTDFYLRDDVVQIAQELLGKILVTCIDGIRTSGRIVETEAYKGPEDQACHARNNRRTLRTQIMFATGGHAYVYLCYGIHHLFNIVTGPKNLPHAVLIRAIEPLENIGYMLQRRRLTTVRPQLCAGPGLLTQALGIHTKYNGLCLTDPLSPIWVENDNHTITKDEIMVGPRIGVAYAGEWADRPWRFCLRNSPWISTAR